MKFEKNSSLRILLSTLPDVDDLIKNTFAY